VMIKKQMITKVLVFVIDTQRMDKTPATMSVLPFPAFSRPKKYQMSQELNWKKNKRKTFLLPILSMGFFAKQFFICEEFVSKLDVATKDTNLTVLLLATIKDKFGKWSGGPDHQGHPTYLDLLTIFTAMMKFRPKLFLP
jgi:hypothetical protein